MKKKILIVVILVVVLTMVVFLLSGCNKQKDVYVVSIEKIETNENQDTYEIIYNDNTKSYFLITHGKDGIQGVKGKDGHSPVIDIGENGNWYIDGVDSKVRAIGIDGKRGERGYEGKRGVGIVSIVKTRSEGLQDIYTITYSDNSTTTFTVTNGKDGIQGIKGNDGHTPEITIGANGNWFIDGEDSNFKARGIQGLSAYELYIKNHPEYKKTEQEWLDDLTSGRLSKVRLSFDTDGGSTISDKIIDFGTYAKEIVTPTKEGFDFVTWTLNGSEIDINTFVFFADSELKAVWKESKYVKVSLNANNGITIPNELQIEYGKNYQLPIPSKQYQTFDGWYYENTLIPTTGTWTYTHNNIELRARWKTTKINVYFNVDENYGELSTEKQAIDVGEKFVLPVPSSIKEGYMFTGWYLDKTKITDKNGSSLSICEWNSSVTLRASYYVEIATIYDFMSLAGKTLNDNYLLTNDLDFQGLCINQIGGVPSSGSFDGDNHTIKNFVLSGALFDGVSGTVRNICFENIECAGKSSEGIVNTLANGGKLENITIKNCFNNTEMSSVLVTTAWGSRVYLKNIHIINSGSKANTLGIYWPETDNDNLPTPVSIDGFYVDEMNNTVSGAGTLFYNIYTDEGTSQVRIIDISNVRIVGNIDNGIIGNKEGAGCSVKLVNAEIRGKTKVAWSGVTYLSNAILNGKTEEWGAKYSEKCIDTSHEFSMLDRGSIDSSIVLMPSANGEYTYISANGDAVTISDVSLIDKNLFVSLLGLSEEVWDLDDIDIKSGKYPKLKI